MEVEENHLPTESKVSIQCHSDIRPTMIDETAEQNSFYFSQLRSMEERQNTFNLKDLLKYGS